MLCLNKESDFFKLYNPQIGGAYDTLPYYASSVRNQRGAGIGGIFGAIGRRLLPLIRNVLLPAAKKHVLPAAKAAFKNVANDVLSGEQSLGNSFKKHSIAALKQAGNSLVNQSGSGIRKRRRKRSTKRAIKHYKKRKIVKNKKKKRKTRSRKNKRQVKTIFDY